MTKPDDKEQIRFQWEGGRLRIEASVLDVEGLERLRQIAELYLPFMARVEASRPTQPAIHGDAALRSGQASTSGGEVGR